MRRTPAIVNSRLAAMLVAACVLTGCPAKKTLKPAVKSSPKPTPTPLALAGETGASKWTLYKSGRKALEVTARSGEVTPGADGSIGAILTGQKAVAFENGKPTLELIGDVSVDTKSQTVTVKKGATARTLSTKSPASVVADAIRWNRMSKTLAGEGNVVFRSEGITLPAQSFTADDALTKLNVQQ